MRDQETIEQACERIVRQGVLCCVSGVVSTLAGGNVLASALDGRYHKLGNAATACLELCEKAAELQSPVLDWEEAATQAGCEQYGSEISLCGMWHHPDDNRPIAFDTPEEICADRGIEPYEWEVFEHWAVSQWLADALIAQGERVDTDFEGLCVWARTTTGQGIAQDSVIRRVVEKLRADYAALTAKPEKATAEKLPIYKPHGLGL